MDQEVHFCQKFTNMNYHWVKMEGSFLPAPLNESNEVDHFLVEPKSDHELGNCLRVQDFSRDFGYEIQTNDAEVDENSFRQNRGLQLGKPSSESKSQGSSRSDTDAFEISELSATMVMEAEFNNTPVERSLTRELFSGLRTRGGCATPFEGNICDTILDNNNIHKFNTNENYLENEKISDENVKGDIVASKLASCSRERRLRKPTRRYIEEFADSKSENNKGRRKPPTKDKYLKVTSTEESNHIRHKVQMLTPKDESHCGTSVPVQSRSQRRHPEKHVPVSGFLSEDEPSATECKNVYSSAKICKKYDRRKHQKMWTLTEVMRLVDGIAEYGTGRWTRIKRHLFASSPHRTPIDLRDKWRNLLKASCVNIQNSKGTECKQPHASRPLPKSLLQRVYELANIYPYPKERSPKSVREATPPMYLIESNSLSFNWGRKKYE
ncbi:Telomere repeat-binding protein 3, partial [Cucurbita argyrosperma subsp. sororia]